MECTAETCKGTKCSRSTKKKDGGFGFECHQHSRLAKYENSDFHLIHGTTLENLKNILKNNALLPIKESKKISQYGIENELEEKELEEYKESVFTAMIFPVGEEGRTTFYPKTEQKEEYVFLIFSVKILELIPNHWCNHWMYGKFINKQCSRYQKSKSLNWNLNNLRSKFRIEIEKNELGVNFPGPHVYGFLPNEVVFKGKIPLEYLEYIYVDKKHTNIEEVQKLAKEYPQYPWVFKNPLKHYKIDTKKIDRYLKGIAEKSYTSITAKISKKFLRNPNYKCAIAKQRLGKCSPKQIKEELYQKARKEYEQMLEGNQEMIDYIKEKIEEAE